jgi:hypothetical protein
VTVGDVDVNGNDVITFGHDDFRFDQSRRRKGCRRFRWFVDA